MCEWHRFWYSLSSFLFKASVEILLVVYSYSKPKGMRCAKHTWNFPIIPWVNIRKAWGERQVDGYCSDSQTAHLEQRGRTAGWLDSQGYVGSTQVWGIWELCWTVVSDGEEKRLVSSMDLLGLEINVEKTFSRSQEYECFSVRRPGVAQGYSLWSHIIAFSGPNHRLLTPSDSSHLLPKFLTKIP